MGAALKLAEVLSALQGLDDKQLKAARKLADSVTAKMRWIPNPGPQTDAFFCAADELFYGGQAGGGKSDLEIGLSVTNHHRSLLLRRTNKEALGLVERMSEVIGNRDGWSGQHGIWRLDDATIEISGCQLEDDKQKFKGSPHDLICVGRGTPVLMGNGSFKPVEAVEVGDQVATLEGPRRIVRAFRVTDKPAVRMTVGDVTQIQSASHKVLTKSGWSSSDDLSALRLCLQPTEYDASGISCEPSLGQAQALSMLPTASNVYQQHTGEQYSATSDQQGQKVLDVCDLLSAQETADESSCASCQDVRRLPVSFDQRAPLLHSQPSADSLLDQHSDARACADDRDGSLLGDFRDDYRGVSRSDDGQPQYLQGLWLVATDDQALFQRPVDVEQPNPIDCSEDSSGNTPTHIRPIRMYPHPYGKGARLTSADLVGSSCSFAPVDVDELFDLEVEDVNHFITAGGIINKNCFDEVSDFTESQYTFIIGWNRSTKPGQRCRIVAAGNPPTRPEGLWVLKRWAAWLDPNHHNPADPGELRWYTTGEDGTEIEVDGPGPHNVSGEMVTARSRTFIPARLSDNPDLEASGYAATLAALPEELRAAYRDGRFDAGLKDRAYQCIPTEWVRMAQSRWTPDAPEGVPMCSMGVDASGGGSDPMIIARRYDGWYAPIIKVAAKEIPIDRAGAYCAGIVISHRRGEAEVIVDLGGGYGSSMYEQLHSNQIKAIGYKGAESAYGKTLCNKFTFNNQRSSAIWRFREALDPGQPGGSVIALPPSATLLADLTAPTYEPDSKQIVVESKKKVCERLGRSTDEGDAVVMAWTKGLKQVNIPGGFAAFKRNSAPKVVFGHQAARRR